MLAVVINSELLDILFFDPRRGEKQITQIGNRYAFSLFAAKWNFIEIIEIAVIVPGLPLTRVMRYSYMPLGVLPAVIAGVNTTRLRHITKQMLCRDTAHFPVIFGND